MYLAFNCYIRSLYAVLFNCLYNLTIKCQIICMTFNLSNIIRILLNIRKVIILKYAEDNRILQNVQ